MISTFFSSQFFDLSISFFLSFPSFPSFTVINSMRNGIRDFWHCYILFVCGGCYWLNRYGDEWGGKKYENNHKNHRWNWNSNRNNPESVEYGHQIFRACIHVIWHANITFIIGHHQLVSMQCLLFDNQWAKKCIWKINSKNVIMNQVDDHWGKWNTIIYFVLFLFLFFSFLAISFLM